MWRTLSLVVAVWCLVCPFTAAKNQEQMAEQIVKVSRYVLATINDKFKNDFAMSLLDVDWATANTKFPPGSVDDICLPPPPLNPQAYTIRDFETELVSFYGMMQDYSVALTHLTLDCCLYNDRDFLKDIQFTENALEMLLDYLKHYILDLQMTPDYTKSIANLKKDYTMVDAARYKRDFTILRDTVDALTLVSFVFQTFK